MNELIERLDREFKFGALGWLLGSFQEDAYSLQIVTWTQPPSPPELWVTGREIDQLIEVAKSYLEVLTSEAAERGYRFSCGVSPDLKFRTLSINLIENKALMSWVNDDSTRKERATWPLVEDWKDRVELKKFVVNPTPQSV